MVCDSSISGGYAPGCSLNISCLGVKECLGARGHSSLEKSPETLPGAQRSCISSHQCPLAFCLEKYTSKNLSSVDP